MSMEVDLEAPGWVYATAKNAKDYTFLVALWDKKYTREALTKNPNLISQKHVLFKSTAVADEKGEGKLDLGPKGEEIREKLKKKGLPNRVDGVLAVLTTSKPDNEDPSKKEGDVMKVTLKQEGPDIELKALVDSVPASKWVAYHHAVCFVEMKISGEVSKVTLEVSPKKQPLPMITGVWEQKAPGQIGMKKLLEGGVGDGHRPNPNCKFKPEEHGRWVSLWRKGASRGKVTIDIPKGITDMVVGLYPRKAGQFTLSAVAPGVAKKKVSFGFAGKHPHPGD